jgi:FkbM family methyltransferase
MRIAIQIGTNDGNDDFKYDCHKSGYDKIYLIEPHSKYNDEIKRKYQGDNIEIINMVITSNPQLTTAKLYRFNDSGTHDSILLRKSHPMRNMQEIIPYLEIPCMTFMKFCESNNIAEVDYLCIDTEGADVEIINSIDFEKVKIRKIIWEGWGYDDDDQNQNYLTGLEFTKNLIAKLQKNNYIVKPKDNANYIALIEPDKRNFPWINIADKEHAYQASKHLDSAPVIFEAGMCDAKDTLLFKKVWPESTVYTFEPNRSLFDIGTRNITSQYGLPDPLVIDGILRWRSHNINLYPYILSDEINQRLFYESDFPATSSIYENNFDDVCIPQTVLNSLKLKSKSDMKVYDEKATLLPSVTIDSIVMTEQIKKLDYLWLDTEGSELLILKGANNILPIVKIVSIELNFQEFRKGIVLFNDIYDYLITKGFVLAAIWQAHEDWQANGIFIRKAIK